MELSSPDHDPASSGSASASHALTSILLGVFMLLGGIISAFAAVSGSFLAGARASAYDLTPLVDMLTIFLVSLVLSVLGICLCYWKGGVLRPRFALVPLVIVPILCFLIGFGTPAMRERLAKKEEVRWRSYYETLRHDPGTALRDRWFADRNPERYITFLKSIDDPNFHYSPQLRQRLIKEDPFLAQLFEVPGRASAVAAALSKGVPADGVIRPPH